MKRAFLCVLLAVACLSLPLSERAQQGQETGTAANQGQSRNADDYAYRLTFFVVEKLEGEPRNAGDPLAQAARELFAPDKQEQIRKDLERKIGPPGAAKRAVKYDALLSKLDVKLSEKKVRELREDLAKNERRGMGRWPWPLCVLVGCK